MSPWRRFRTPRTRCRRTTNRRGRGCEKLRTRRRISRFPFYDWSLRTSIWLILLLQALNTSQWRSVNSGPERGSLKTLNSLLKLRLNPFGSLLQARIRNGLHRGHWIDGGHFRPPSADILNHDVAGEHRADFIFQLQCFMCERRIARPENTIIAEIDIDLLLQRVLHVDLGNDSEAFLLERIDRAAHGLVEINCQCFCEVVAHCKSPGYTSGRLSRRGRVSSEDIRRDSSRLSRTALREYPGPMSGYDRERR